MFVSAWRAALLPARVVLPIQDVLLRSPWQRQEAHEDRRPDAQATEMLQTGGARRRTCDKRSGASAIQVGGRRFSFTLQPADVGPLLRLHHGRLQLGAKGHLIRVVQQDANNLA